MPLPAPPQPRTFVRSPVASLLAGLVLFVGLLVVLRPGADRTSRGDGLGGAITECAPGDACEQSSTDEPFVQQTGPSVLASDVCPLSAYLCHGLSERGIRRVMRWPDDVREIEIRVPLPGYLEPGAGRDLQAAAVRGILAWQNAPLPLRVTRSDRPGSEDFTVSWTQSVLGNELGRTATQWEVQDGAPVMRVVELVLATHGSGPSPRALDADVVMLTAAHEMGHALGLPHSDDERDLMYPTNTARRMSTRDYRAMEALYSLENGAELIGETR